MRVPMMPPGALAHGVDGAAVLGFRRQPSELSASGGSPCRHSASDVAEILTQTSPRRAMPPLSGRQHPSAERLVSVSPSRPASMTLPPQRSSLSPRHPGAAPLTPRRQASAERVTLPVGSHPVSPRRALPALAPAVPHAVAQPLPQPQPAQAVPPPQPAVPQAVCQEDVEHMDDIIQHRGRCTAAVKAHFEELAEEDEDGLATITFEQAVEIAPAIAEELELPPYLFNDMYDLALKFDFDGDGLLEFEECDKLFRFCVRQRRIELAGHEQEIAVPEKSLEEAGYLVKKELGKGGFGAIYLARYGALGLGEYCIKFFDKSNRTPGALHGFIEEYALMKDFSSKYVAKTYEIFQDDLHYYLVNEPYYGGDLTKLGLKAIEKGVSMSESWWRGLFKRCLEGLSYLHKCCVIHCDLKENNIMVAYDDDYKNPRPVLIDFGLSESFSQFAGKVCGTPGYIPPETWPVEKGHWYPVGDVFSMGIIFFQLMTGHVPREGATAALLAEGFHPMDMEGLARSAKSRPLPWNEFPCESMPELAVLVESMTSRDYLFRPRAQNCLDHDWFASSSDASLPEDGQERLLAAAAHSVGREKVLQDLGDKNNLDALRALQEHVNMLQNAFGKIAGDEFAHSLVNIGGTCPDATQKLIDNHNTVDGDSACYRGVVQAAIDEKEVYNKHALQDIFSALDIDGNGQLDRRELQAILEVDLFEIPYHDIDEILQSMDTNHDGQVSFEEFRRVAMEDGRISKRSAVPRLQKMAKDRHSPTNKKRGLMPIRNVDPDLNTNITHVKFEGDVFPAGRFGHNGTQPQRCGCGGDPCVIS